ncbi:MAG TPA: cytochrome P460 family protein [Burkholderiales bacterium]|nr:cytochrome P460 family protein [Burkholderiales bacterium]
MGVICRRAFLLCGIAAGMLPASVGAGPDRIVFPAGYRSGVLYTTVDRADIKQYRELYASAEAVKAAQDGKPLPDGTVLTLVQYKVKLDDQGNPVKDANGRFVKAEIAGYTVMEKRAGWGAEYPPELRNGDWEYSVFTADGKFNDKANFKSCFECHKPHVDKDYVMSYVQLAGKFPTAAVQAKGGPDSVVIASFAFAPAKLTVAPGQKVTWTNADDSPHQVSVQGKPGKTAVLLKGQSAGLLFEESGDYNYACALHPTMKGSVQVAK